MPERAAGARGAGVMGGGARGRPGEVAIGRLGLSLPGSGHAAGERLAGRIGEALARRLPAGATGHIEHLELTVRPPRGASDDAVVEAVVEAVLRRMPQER